MRSLSAEILAAQRADSCSPATVLMVGANNYSARIKQLRHIERPYGGTATILLDNSDKGITDDLRGNKVSISYGFETVDVSAAAPLWVLTQRDVSIEGLLAQQLECIDIWLKLSLLRIITGGGVQLDGTITGFFNYGMKVTGQTSGATGTVTYTGEGYIAVGNVAKTFEVGETVQSDVYSESQIVVSAVADFGGGSAPAWNGDKTVLEIIQQLTSGVVEVVLDDSDGIVDLYWPTYETEVNTPIIEIIQDMMNRTTSGIRMGGDEKLHIFPITDTLKYSYDSDHAFLVDLRDTSSILPNRIIVIYALPSASGLTTFSGSAQDDDAFARFGLWVTQVVLANVQDNAEADAIALLKLWRIQREATRGRIEVPIMNVGQELFDYIRVTDTRAGIDYYGWVGSLEHLQGPGRYSLNVELGGLMGGERLPGDAEYPLPNLPTVMPPSAGSTYITALAALGFGHNIVFTAVDYNTVSWTDGTIVFSNGTEKSVNSGSLDPLTATHYIYYERDNADLQSTTTYSGAIGQNKVLIAVAKIASDDSNEAFIFALNTGQQFLNRDNLSDYIIDELQLASDAIKNRHLTPGCVNYESIGANQVFADHIYSINLTTLRAVVLELSALSANIGTITAGTISGVTIYGVTIYGSTIYAGGTDVVLDASGIRILGQRLAIHSATDVPKGYFGYYTSGTFIGLNIHSLDSHGINLLCYGGGNVWSNSSLKPLNLEGQDLGDSYYRWRQGWFKELFVRTQILPTASHGATLGNSGFYFDKLFVDDIDIGLGGQIVGPAGAGSRHGTATYYPEQTHSDEWVLHCNIPAFSELDDIALLRSIQEKGGKLDIETFPDLICVAPDTDLENKIIDAHCKGKSRKEQTAIRKEANEKLSKKAVSMGSWQALNMGAILELAKRVEALEGGQP